MNRKIIQGFVGLVERYEQHIINLLNNKNYVEMEQEYKKYKKLRENIVQIIPSENLEEGCINQ